MARLRAKFSTTTSTSCFPEKKTRVPPPSSWKPHGRKNPAPAIGRNFHTSYGSYSAHGHSGAGFSGNEARTSLSSRVEWGGGALPAFLNRGSSRAVAPSHQRAALSPPRGHRIYL